VPIIGTDVQAIRNAEDNSGNRENLRRFGREEIDCHIAFPFFSKMF